MKEKQILFILTSSCILVLIWIGFSVYRASIESTVSEELNQQITPITPDFDMKVVLSLRDRAHVEPEYTIKAASKSASLQVFTTPTLSPKPSGKPSLTQTPSKSTTLTPTLTP